MDTIEAGVAKATKAALPEWVDQNGSPLGKRRHLRLAREGKLPSKKNGRRVLVHRDDMRAFIDESAESAPPRDWNDVDRELRELGFDLRGAGDKSPPASPAEKKTPRRGNVRGHGPHLGGGEHAKGSAE
jgi:hypothetical protein